MSARHIKIEFATHDALMGEFHANLKNGGTFVAGATSLQQQDECDIELVHPVTHTSLIIHSRIVWVAPDGTGAGVAFVGFTSQTRDDIAAFIKDAGEDNHQLADKEPAQDFTDISEPFHSAPLRDENFADEESALPLDTAAQSVHQRLRNLSMADQQKVARGGHANERIVLERIYGKNVWEPLLQNPRLTIPEVARIARMGGLPTPLMELIVGNPSWVSSPPIRRALLTNPRLGRDQIPRVLKTMPLAELRLVPQQMGYTAAVRETARRILRT